MLDKVKTSPYGSSAISCKLGMSMSRSCPTQLSLNAAKACEACLALHEAAATMISLEFILTHREYHYCLDTIRVYKSGEAYAQLSLPIIVCCCDMQEPICVNIFDIISHTAEHDADSTDTAWYTFYDKGHGKLMLRHDDIAYDIL